MATTNNVGAEGSAMNEGKGLVDHTCNVRGSYTILNSTILYYTILYYTLLFVIYSIAKCLQGKRQ